MVIRVEVNQSTTGDQQVKWSKQRLEVVVVTLIVL